MLEKIKIAAISAKGKIDYYDYNLIMVVLILTSFGLIMLYSTSSYTGQQKFDNDFYYFSKQALISFFAFVFMIFASRFDYRMLVPVSAVIYIGSLIGMLLVQTPLGVVRNGARRWLKIGIQFQPSELAKLAVVVFLPCLIVKIGRNINSRKGCSFVFGAGLILAAAAYIFTDNLSTAVIIAGMTFFLTFIAYPKSIYFYILMAAGVVVTAIILLVLYNHVDSSSSFRIERILVWFNPEKYASDKGYQVLQSLYAIGSGGLSGKGLGNSAQKLGPVPEAENDMIFSIICEELGIIGAFMVLLLFGYLLYRLHFIAQNAPDMLGALMVSGIFIHIALQVILNICVVTNLIPTTGVTLPFVSYGGTSIIFLMAEMSIALSVSRQIKFKTAAESNEEEDNIFGVM